MRGSKVAGFHAVAVVLVVAVLAVAGLVGWRVWDASQTKPEPSATEAVANAVPAVNSTKDLSTVDDFIGHLDTAAEQEELTKMEQELNAL